MKREQIFEYYRCAPYAIDVNFEQANQHVGTNYDAKSC